MTTRQRIACRRLAELVERNLNSFECEQFRRRREAAKLGHQRRADAHQPPDSTS